MLHGAPALVPATGTVVFADAKAPALRLPLHPVRAQHLPHGQADRIWGTMTIYPYPPPSRGCCALGWFLCYPPCTCLQNPYIEVLHRLCDIELVHSGDDDGRSGEKEEKDEEDYINHKAADPPYKAPDGEVFPGREKESIRMAAQSRIPGMGLCVHTTAQPGEQHSRCQTKASPLQSDQTSSLARLGFSKNNSLSYPRSRWRGRKEGCTPLPLAGPLNPTELLTSRYSVGQEHN